MLTLAGKHILLMGPTGSGKSSILRYLDSTSDCVFLHLKLNPSTTAADITAYLESHLPASKKNVIGDPQGRKIIISIEDVNIVAADSSALDLLRHLANGTYFDHNK